MQPSAPGVVVLRCYSLRTETASRPYAERMHMVRQLRNRRDGTESDVGEDE